MSDFDEIKSRLLERPNVWLITGVAGFIGSNLLEALLKLNQQVVGLDSFSTGHQKNLDEVQTVVTSNQWDKFTFIKEGDDSKKSFKRLHRWRYSPTAAYGNNEVHLHPYKARRISAAEALAIQSLPPEFHFPNTMTLSNMFKTIGNGVPFVAAKGLAGTIESFLTEYC